MLLLLAIPDQSIPSSPKLLNRLNQCFHLRNREGPTYTTVCNLRFVRFHLSRQNWKCLHTHRWLNNYCFRIRSGLVYGRHVGRRWCRVVLAFDKIANWIIWGCIRSPLHHSRCRWIPGKNRAQLSNQPNATAFIYLLRITEFLQELSRTLSLKANRMTCCFIHVTTWSGDENRDRRWNLLMEKKIYIDSIQACILL